MRSERLRSRRLIVGPSTVCSLMGPALLHRRATAIRNDPEPTLRRVSSRRASLRQPCLRQLLQGAAADAASGARGRAPRAPDCGRREVGAVDRSNRRELLGDLNPARRVPTLVLDDGRPLAESNAIIWYLGERSRFVPDDAYERALVLQWMFFEQ